MHPDEDDEFLNNIDYLVNETQGNESQEYLGTVFDGSLTSRYRKSTENRAESGNAESKNSSNLKIDKNHLSKMKNHHKNLHSYLEEQ